MGEVLVFGGGTGLSAIRYLIHHIPGRDAILTEILRRAIPQRYLSAICLASSVLLRNDRPIIRLRKLRLMKNENLKSTTVRFTDTDLYLIDSLQQKLGSV